MKRVIDFILYLGVDLGINGLLVLIFPKLFPVVVIIFITMLLVGITANIRYR